MFFNKDILNSRSLGNFIICFKSKNKYLRGIKNACFKVKYKCYKMYM